MGEERLINARRLKSKVEALCKDERTTISAIAYFALMQVIDSSPTVEIQSVKHGRWLDYGRDNDWVKFYRCSICKDEMADTSEANFVIEKYKYCPFCGARMGGGSE